jgi:hypothetical protein
VIQHCSGLTKREGTVEGVCDPYFGVGERTRCYGRSRTPHSLGRPVREGLLREWIEEIEEGSAVQARQARSRSLLKAVYFAVARWAMLSRSLILPVFRNVVRPAPPRWVGRWQRPTRMGCGRSPEGGQRGRMADARAGGGRQWIGIGGVWDGKVIQP